MNENRSYLPVIHQLMRDCTQECCSVARTHTYTTAVGEFHSSQGKLQEDKGITQSICISGILHLMSNTIWGLSGSFPSKIQCKFKNTDPPIYQYTELYNQSVLLPTVNISAVVFNFHRMFDWLKLIPNFLRPHLQIQFKEFYCV